MKVFLAVSMFCALSFSCSLPALADGQVAFAYQGRVRVQGQPYDGQGQFKFAIVNTSGTTTLWSHDGTSSNGSAPTSHIQLPVVGGIFTAMIGDSTVTPNPINGAIFNSPTPLKLRTWFNGGLGFQQLNPDQNLVNLTLNVLETGQQDFTVYVNGTTGSDSNNGLTTTTAKQTIQAAVDTLPERIRCNVNIDVADGVYRETVRIFGLSVIPGKTIKIIGDENWTPQSASPPSVRITGTNQDVAPSRIREYGIVAVQCSYLAVRGILFNHNATSAVQVENGVYDIQNCKVTDNAVGVYVSDSSATCSQVAVSLNSGDGIYITRNSSAVIRTCSSFSNGGCGLVLNGQSTANLGGIGNYSSNISSGYKVQHHSAIVFSGGSPAHSATVSGNGNYGLNLSYQSYSENHTSNNFGTGNTPANIYQIFGGTTTY